MSDIDDLRARIERSLDLSEHSLDELERAAPSIIGQLLDQHTTARKLTTATRDRASELQLTTFAETIEFGRRAIAIERRLLELQGDPDELRRLAALLDEQVHTAARELADEVRSDADDGLEQWGGQSGAAFRVAAADHDRALDAAAESGAAMAGSLGSLADALDEFSGQLTSSVGSLQQAVTRLVVGVLSMVTGTTAIGESDRFVGRLTDLMQQTDDQLRRFLEDRIADEDRVRAATAEAPDDWDEGRRR